MDFQDLIRLLIIYFIFIKKPTTSIKKIEDVKAQKITNIS